MRIEHIVFLRLRKLTEAEWKPIKTCFYGMKQKIPGILDMSIGPNISPSRADGYTYALRVLFDNENSLRLYADHPEHVAFKKLLLFESDQQKPNSICLDWTLDN